MRSRFVASIAGSVGAIIAAGAIMLSASAASAYVPDGRVSISPASVSPGGTVTVTAEPGSFTPGEPVRIAVNGLAALRASIGLLAAASVVAAPQVETTSLDGAASPTGALAARITAPSDGAGAYTVVLTGLDSGRVYTAAFSVTPSAGAAAGQQSGGTLPNTGADAGQLVGLGGIAFAALAAGIIAARTERRRQDAGASTAER